MTKLLKNSKSVLSFVLAFAVLAVSLFTGVVINTQAACSDGTIDLLRFGDYLLELGSTDVYMDTKLADNDETGADWNNAIIIDSAEELVYLCKRAGDETKDKYYKVADGIAGFNLSKDGTLDYNGTYEDNLNKIKAGGDHSGSGSFQGHFDGNGATVYGAYINGANQAGLFPLTKGNVTVKNINVKLSHLVANLQAGGIIGYHTNNGAANTLVIENCAVTESHIENKNSGWGYAAGAIIGYVGNSDVTYTINNCFVHLKQEHLVANDAVVRGGLTGFSYTNKGSMTNCIVIGVTPYATTKAANTSANGLNWMEQSAHSARFTNIYTDMPSGSVSVGAGKTYNYTGRIYQLTTTQMKGIAAVDNMDLDWSVWMADDEGYPEFRFSHSDVKTVSNEDGTHSVTCATCGFGGAPQVCNYDATQKCADCGFEVTCATRKTIYWDGSRATGFASGTGEKNDPYIIETASQLAYLVTQKADVTGGKYFKIADGIGAIVLQNKAAAEQIMAFDSAAETKAYFEANSATAYRWNINWGAHGWEGTCFAGSFDGNGATIYGMYSPVNGNAALFLNVDGGATIKNIALKNSYLSGSHSGYQVAGIAATGYGGSTAGVIWINNCIVANCYMKNASTAVTRSGVIAGNINTDILVVDNCLAYGNDATYGNGVKMPLAGCLGKGDGSINKNAVKPEELTDCVAYVDFLCNTVRNTVALGCDVMNVNDVPTDTKYAAHCYENVYTDGAAGTVNLANGKVVTYNDAQVKKINSGDLSTLELGESWIATNGMPELKAFHDDTFATQDNHDGTHSSVCSCGLLAETAEHTWENGECTVCGSICAHTETEFVPKSGPSCTEGQIGDDVCKVCECVVNADVAGGESALGHDLKQQIGYGATCTEPGVKDYYDCTRCDFVSEDAEGNKPIPNLDEWKVIPEKGHEHAKDPDGVAIYIVNDAGHQKVCGVCDQPYGDVESHTGEPVANGAEGHKITCTVQGCGFASDNAPHNFGGDTVCDTCTWTCTAHSWVDDGEPVELGLEATKDACKKVAQKCDICGIAGQDRIIGHEVGDWETPWMDMNKVNACAGDGQHTEVKICQVCWFEVDRKIVTDPKAGHSFVEYEAQDATCSSTGYKEHKMCEVCWNYYAIDAAYDEAYENALDWSNIETPINPENHTWKEISADATCEEDGVVAHKYCTGCNTIIMGDEQYDITIDWDKYYEYDQDGNPVGPGAILDASYNEVENEALAEFIAENYADSGIEVPEYPAEDATDAEWLAYWEAYDPIMFTLSEIDEDVYEKWDEYWTALWSDMQASTRYLVAVAAATEAGADFVIPATGHTIVKVDEVAATYEKDGVKAHYACECGKLYSDAEGKNEVTAESLVIAKLVKEENKPSTDDKAPTGDKSNESPKTGESVATVAAVAALMGAAFVLVRKAKKA